MTNQELITWAVSPEGMETGLSKEQAVQLLSIEIGTEEYKLLGEAARELASRITGDKAYLWGAIGVDFAPCSMNCDFCSLGEAWGITKDTREYDEAETIRQVREYAEQGVYWIVLRTTEFYSKDQLASMIQAIRREVPGDYRIGLNIGEFNLETANWLADCGVNFVYHSLRLGEGKDTRFNPQDRIDTLNAAKDSKLDLVFLVEPVGIEHTNEEIAEIAMLAKDCDVIVSGAMARVPVEGTPLGVHPQISNERLAQIIAVTRLLGGRKVPDICVHPYCKEAADFGANVTVIETGSVPRDNCCCSGGKWNQFDAGKAKAAFAEAGYTVCPSK
ncbi:MAG: radical SAM protein [Emergencia sp.]|nr:radical SAM protein [Emergencia sp.]